jgi:DNA polymerase-3 subunit gamma/tau
MSLYLKYRPQTFDEVVGNEAVITAMRSERAKDSHAILMSGGSGCGKTTLGRIFARELGCVGGDFVELDTADFRGIETIRSVRRQVDFKPMEGPVRVWLLDEVHGLSNDAQDALLKTLEEPPPHVYFILCTTAPQKLKPTIRSRCTEYTVQPLEESEMISLLRKVVKGENATLQKALYQQIARDSLGHPRKALTILEQVLGMPEDKQAAIATKAAEEQSAVIDLCRALLKGASWKQVANIVAGLKQEEPESVRIAVLGYCTSFLLKEENMRAGAIMEAFLDPWFDSGYQKLVFATFSVVAGAD